MQRIVLTLFLLLSCIGYGQKDYIKLINNDVIVGEIKQLEAGILSVETSYSDDDFTIEFNKVSELVIERKCVIVLTKGRRVFGNIKTYEPGQALITLEDQTEIRLPLSEVVILEEVSDKFWKRVSAEIDFGLNLAKANDNLQFTINGKLDYIGAKWLAQGDVSMLNASQEGSPKTKRTSANMVVLKMIPNNWYFLGKFGVLSNTEQALNARISTSAGMGLLLTSTIKLYFYLAGGYNYNIENIEDGSLNKTSSELFTSLKLNMFDFEDLDLDTQLDLYPSLSERKRFRADYSINLKYDLPLEFYIKLGFTLNYDNQPAVTGNDVDYIVFSGFGWEFN